MKFISEAEATGICGIARRTLFYAAEQKKVRTHYSPRVTANGRRPRLYCLDDLGADAARKYHEHLLASRAAREEKLPVVQGDGTLIDPQSGEILWEPVALTASPEWALLEANWRVEIVQQALAVKKEFKGNATPALQDLARKNDIAFSTLYNYISSYKFGGYQALLPNWKRPPSIDPQIEGYIKYLWLQPTQLLASSVHREVLAYATENELKAPSYSTVVRVIQSIDEATATYCRIGRKAWSDKFEPVLRRDYSDLAVGEFLCGDHRELDLFISDGKRVFRPWLTAWMDLRTRKITGWHIDVAPNSRTIAVSFRNSVLLHGRPGVVYVDNGRDYDSHYLNGQVKKIGKIHYDSELLGVFGHLNVQVIHAIPFCARSKPIERWFLNIPQQFERALPGWCGRNNKQRPEKLKGEIDRGELLTLDQLRERFTEFVNQYNARVHSEIGCSPNSLWESATPQVLDVRALDMCLMKHKPAKVCNDGIHLFGMLYWHSKLSGYMGQMLEIRYDTADVGTLYVFSAGQFVCEAKTAVLGSMKTGEAVMKQKAKERKAARQRITNQQRDLQILYSPAAAIAAANEALGPTPDAPAPAPAKRTGKEIKVITRFDGMAKQVDAEAPAAKSKPSTWEKFTARMEKEMAAQETQQADAERIKKEKQDRQLRRALGEDFQQILGGQ